MVLVRVLLAWQVVVVRTRSLRSLSLLQHGKDTSLLLQVGSKILSFTANSVQAEHVHDTAWQCMQDAPMRACQFLFRSEALPDELFARTLHTLQRSFNKVVRLVGNP